MALQGIDVSAYQNPVNWATVANSGIYYAFAKATEGETFVDPSFATNWATMRSAGIIRGAYHFFRPGKDPRTQANNFLKALTPTLDGSDLPPVLDLEVLDNLTPGVVLDRANQWLKIIESATGRKPIIYTFPVFWEERLGNPTQLANYPLWVANFGTQDPYVPSAWKDWAFHQFSESGTVAGIASNVDLNQFNGNHDDLQKLLTSKILLRQGATGQVVVELQQKLRTNGFDIGSLDGAFGPKTKTAVIAFQKVKGLVGDGIVGPATWAALTGPPKPTPIPTPTPAPAPKPVSPPPAPAIVLVNVCKSYGAKPHQDQALNWLQGQLPQATLDEFAKRWRQTP
jgi:lysozyme